MLAKLVDHIDDLRPEAFNALGDIGAVGTYDRVRQIGRDPRWPAKFVVVFDHDGVLRAAVPLFLGRGGPWSDPLHSPDSWGGSPPPPLDQSAAVGGRQDLRATMHCHGDPAVVAAVRDVCRNAPELRGRQLHLGYLDARQKAVAEAVFGPIRWLATYDDLIYPTKVVQDPAALPKKTRELLKQDRRRIAELDIRTEIGCWDDRPTDTAELIARHNVRKGLDDHPELVEYRMETWAECAGVEIHVARATADSGAAVMTILVTGDEIEAYEIGMPGGEGSDRLYLYLALSYHLPVELARASGRSTVRVGMGADRAKRLRGAQIITRYCGTSTPYPASGRNETQ